MASDMYFSDKYQSKAGAFKLTKKAKKKTEFDLHFLIIASSVHGVYISTGFPWVYYFHFH